MLPKRIKATIRQGYRQLAEYIAAANEKGEKLDEFWAVNCDAGDGIKDLEQIILEVQANQRLNTRARGERTYHLMISFERDEKPPYEVMREIDRQCARALGFDDHKRVAGTHQNTNMFHIHIAYDMISPINHYIHHPSFDYANLEKACRSLEAQFGLKPTNGRFDNIKRDPMTAKARDVEAHTWLQSFNGYVVERMDILEASRKAAKSWQDIHAAFAVFDMTLTPRGKGLVISDAKGMKHHMKPSSLGREFGMPSLERQLGPFEPARRDMNIRVKESFGIRPITKHKDQGPLWKEYLIYKDSKTLTKYMSGPATILDPSSKSSGRGWRRFLHIEAAGRNPLAQAIIDLQLQPKEERIREEKRAARAAAEELSIEEDYGISM